MRVLNRCIRPILLIVLLTAPAIGLFAQEHHAKDTIPPHQGADSLLIPADTVDVALRIKNLNPFFSIHVDSMLNYNLEINKDESKYYWYLRNSPVGLRINKDNGVLTFKAEKSYFLSGKLKYDNEYKVNVGVQNLDNPNEHVDTSFYIQFYNTDII